MLSSKAIFCVFIRADHVIILSEKNIEILPVIGYDMRKATVKTKGGTSEAGG